MRRPLLGTVVVLLVVSLSVAATAQQEEPAPIMPVTGTVVEHYGYEFSDEDEGDLTSYDLRGYEVKTQTAPIRQVVEWSDPRLPADLWLTLGYTVISTEADDFEGAINVAWQSLLEDDDGTWRGTGRSVQGADQKYSLHVLTGEGAYEGLSALLRGMPPDDEEAGLLHTHAPWDMAYEGYIFEAELTPLPGAPDPLATGTFRMWPIPTE